MDFRTSQSSGRQPAHRPEPVRRTEQRPPAAVEEPAPAHRPAQTHYMSKPERSKKRFIIPIVAAVVVVALLLGGWALMSRGQEGVAGIDNGKYQAVFFTNGQVYFGKLTSLNEQYLKLTDIYYLQTQQTEQTEEKDSKNPQQTSSDQNNVQLIKLGNEVHGPEDEMVISRDQVLFYENLKSDGKVAQTIEQSKKQ